MSEEWIELKNETLPGEWWWLSVFLHPVSRLPLPHPHVLGDMKAHADGWQATLFSDPYDNRSSMGTITFTANGESTVITVRGPASAQRDWDLIMGELSTNARAVQSRRRRALGRTFTVLLDDYYERKARGERVKLKDMADAAGVKYGSLRQAKFRYDEEQRKNASGG